MATERIIVVRRFRTGSVFRIATAGIFFSLVPFFILMGVLALFGLSTIKWNDVPVLGVRGFLASPLMGLFAASLFTALGGGGMAFGLWLYSKLKPLTLRYLEDDASPPLATAVGHDPNAT